MLAKKPDIKKRPSLIGASLKESKTIITTTVGVKPKVIEPKTAEPKKSVKVNSSNPKQISIQLFSSKLRNSSKSTPMMSFKIGEEGGGHLGASNITPKLTPKNSLKDSDRLNKVIGEINANGYNTHNSNVNKIKVNRNSLRDRNSITSKEDVFKCKNLEQKIIPSKVIAKKSCAGTKINLIEIKNEFLTPKLIKGTPNSPDSTPILNMKHNSNPTLLNSYNILTTNYSDLTKDNKELDILNKDESTNMNAIKSEYIINSIQTLGTLLKAQNTPQKMKELLNDQQTSTKINKLNSMLNNLNIEVETVEQKNDTDVNLKEVNDSNNLLMENNVIRRDTFIDNNFNKKLLVNKENIINEIYSNSDIRMKKYNILFDFIHSNIKEITELVSQNNTMNRATEDENIIFDKDAVNELDQENINEKSPMKMLSSRISNSFVDSASDIDFYKNLADNTINYNLDNFSNDMSCVRKMDYSHTVDKNDETHIQYDDYVFRSKTTMQNKIINDTIFAIDSVPEETVSKQHFINPQSILKHLQDSNYKPVKSPVKHTVRPSPDPVEVQSKCYIF